MSRKLFLMLALILGLFAGCKTEEPAEPQLRSVALAAALPEKPKEKKDYKKELEQIIQEHNVKYIGGIYLYTPDHKQELFDAIRERYSYDEETIKQYKQALDERQERYGPLILLPRERIGKGQSSLLCLFSGMTNYIQTKDDLISEIAGYAGHRAKDNAEGITLCGKRILLEEINLLTPLVYQDLLDLRARTHQVNEIARKKMPVSQQFKETIFLKYANTCVNIGLALTSLELMRKKAMQEGGELEPKYKQMYAFLEDAVKQAKEALTAEEPEKE